MYKFQYVTKSGWLSIVAAALISFIGMPLACAGSYIYSLTDLSGYITTNCDNCVLNSSNITAWSMSVPGFISLSSTTPGAQLSVPAGDTDMTATPAAINFSFSTPYGGFVFATPSAYIAYQDAGPYGDIGFGPGFGVVAACKNDSPGDCMFIGGGQGTQSIALAVVPFASFTAAAKLHLSTAAGDSRFRLEGMFALGGQHKVFPPGSPNLQLTVGSVALFLPAGSLSASGNGYEFHGPVNGGVLHPADRAAWQWRLQVLRRGFGI